MRKKKKYVDTNEKKNFGNNTEICILCVRALCRLPAHFIVIIYFILFFFFASKVIIDLNQIYKLYGCIVRAAKNVRMINEY